MSDHVKNDKTKRAARRALRGVPQPFRELVADKGFLRADEHPEIEGPISIFGYDGLIHFERADANEWRQFRLDRARKLGTHTATDWQQLLIRVGCCAICGAADKQLFKDHVVPLARGGCDCIQNIQPLCFSCNSRKGSR